MNMSFWSHFQSLIVRLQHRRADSRHRSRHRAMASFEALEPRALLSATPAMIADINPGAATSNPANLVAIGTTTFFAADDGVHGTELWKSDGSTAGTRMVADMNPGAASSYPSDLTNVNGTLFFSAHDNTHGEELWKSDGTSTGTIMVKDIGPRVGSYPRYLTNVNGTLFFSADDEMNGRELWKSDGTATGTTVVKDIAPGSGISGMYGGTYPLSSNPSSLTSMNGTLFFSASDGSRGIELWKSDGTSDGTILVKDINPNGASYPSNLINVNGTLYFSASDGSSGAELWKSDGTAAGTSLIKDIYPGTTTWYSPYFGGGTLPNGSNPASLTNVNGTLFFSAEDGTNGRELWKSDGTTTGTTMVKDIYRGATTIKTYYGTYYTGTFTYTNNSNPDNLTNLNGTLLFTANDEVAGVELWKSDGTAAGTTMISDINPGSTASGPASFTNVNGKLFFRANDGTHGSELWKTDGTAAGTAMVADISPGTGSSLPGNLTNLNGTLLFTANDDSHGNELWELNTTPAPSLAVTGFPTTPTAGVAGTFTVTAQNADGTRNAGYTGTVRFSTDDVQATIVDPATGHAVQLRDFTYTFTAADAGAHIFGATLKTAGYQMIGVADTHTIAINGAESILVKSAAASAMTVGGFPLTTTAGAVQNLTVTLQDPYGNIATGYTGTVHFSSTDAKAMLPANYAFTAADAGMHNFSVTLKTAGMRSMTAADTLVSTFTATVAGITVNAATATKFLITAPSTVTAGLPFNLILTVEDAYGNVVNNYIGTVHFTSTDRTATLPANYTFTTADKGVHTFVGLVMHKRGKQTITITESSNNLLTTSVTENVQ